MISKNKSKKNNDKKEQEQEARTMMTIRIIEERRTMKNTNGRKQKPGMRYLLLKRGQHIPITKLRNQYH